MGMQALFCLDMELGRCYIAQKMMEHGINKIVRLRRSLTLNVELKHQSEQME